MNKPEASNDLPALLMIYRGECTGCMNQAIKTFISKADLTQ